MLKFIFRKKNKCEHNYRYIGEEIPYSRFEILEKSRNYIFKCDKCEDVIAINNYDVIEKIQRDFMDLLFEELSKPQIGRMWNKSFMDSVWSKYSENDTINTALRENLNVCPISLGRKEIRSITEEDILSLKFAIKYTEIKVDSVCKELDERGRYIIAKNKKGKHINVEEFGFKVDIKDEIRILDSVYLRQGIKKEYIDLMNEAITNVSESFGIEVDAEKVELLR